MISWLEKRRGISWIITVFIGMLIFYVSSLTFEAGSGGGTGIKAIIYHIFVFFLFGFFLSVSLVKGKRKSFLLLAIIIGVIYGIFDEIHQLFVPGRSGSLGDVFLDTTGVLFAFVIYFILIENRKKFRV